MLTIHCTDGAFQLHSDDDSAADRERIAAILAAYSDAEHAQVFRHLLCLRLGVGAAIWIAVGVLTPLLPTRIFAGVAALLGAAVVTVWLVEWRAERRLLDALLGRGAHYPGASPAG